MLMSIPGHIIFVFIIVLIEETLRFNALFFALYMLIALMQVDLEGGR